MGDWSYLVALLDKVQAHSTVVGKIWMSVLFLFRIFVLGAAADKVWGDELSEFQCNTPEPGCEHNCYNWMFPISYVHYWVLQITFVSTPTLVYLGHAIHIIHKEKRMMEQQKDQSGLLKKPKYTDDRGKVKIKGILFCTYVTQLVFKILLEAAFAVGQVYIFGSIITVPYFHCTELPCPIRGGTECYVSRPTEKTFFVIFMLAVSGVSVLLNIIELIYLICDKSKRDRKRLQASSQQHPSGPVWGPGHHVGFPLPQLPAQDVSVASLCKEKNT
ncbi:gap junction Cx32.2 protein-like [Genypterus blacodes]|uniref:gap junction Cx32.2 protein-like n=1 Tax=Genypterus blacodes TaxID=154954 RepID=UPI003F7750F1